MKKYTVYHNPRCSKSRCAIQHLDKQKVEYEVVEYLKESPSAEQLTEILKMLAIPAADLIRKGEADFKDNYKGKELSESEWISAMVKYPKLIERPIVVLDGKAIIARPLERINALG